MTDENPVQGEEKAADAGVKTPKTRTRRKAAAAEQPVKAAAKSEPATEKTKRYSSTERNKIMAAVAKSLGGGKALKPTLKAAGISEQTYYRWKKSADEAAAAPAARGDDLKDLIELEAENQRLRKELADKLRAENAELRRRLAKA